MSREGISVEGLSFSYPEYPGLPARPLLSGLDLRLEAGEIGVLLGASGVGKTTLARVLGGLAPRFTGGTLEGEVRAAGADIGRSMPYDLVDRVGLVFQHPDEQIVGTRCDAEVAFALESLGIERPEMERRVRDALALFGLADFASRNPATLSGGEKKRLLLACLEAAGPPVWVLDEAFEELDPAWRRMSLEHLCAAGKTALVLDSRWSAAFRTRVDRHAVLAAGALRGMSRTQEAPAFQAAMQSAGLVPPAGRIPGPAAAARGPYVRVRGLSFAFQGGSFSLEVDDLEIDRGSVTALVGPNGSGKSTLARLLCGLLEPARGVIEIDRGRGFAAAAANELNRLVGCVFQDPDHQIFMPTVRDELALSLRADGGSAAVKDRRIAEAIESFGLPAAETPTALMSYGSRKLLQAAACWLLDRALIILDEADSGLSYASIAGLLGTLLHGGAGILLVTHDAVLAAAAADRVIAMDAGTIAADSGSEALGRALAAGGLDP